MKAEELRIGNYVKGKSPERETYEQPVKVEIHYLEMYCRDPKRVHYKPIPLTEDWLVKFGFKLKDTINVGYLIPINYEHQKEYLYCSKRGVVALYNETNKKDFIIMNSCEHVHQLQNLYFALTNKELTI